MKMKTLWVTLAFAFMLFGCGKGYVYWDISKFNMDETALQDKEEIRLLYSSRGPDNNEDKEYYVHLVAISLTSGDTVNILTTVNTPIDGNDRYQVYNFFNQDNLATQIAQMDMESIKELGHVDELKDQEQPKITKVCRDINHDDIADNDYPTVIGTIGKLSSIDE